MEAGLEGRWFFWVLWYCSEGTDHKHILSTGNQHLEAPPGVLVPKQSCECAPRL